MTRLDMAENPAYLQYSKVSILRRSYNREFREHQKVKKFASNSWLQTVQILTNDVQMLILGLSYSFPNEHVMNSSYVYTKFDALILSTNLSQFEELKNRLLVQNRFFSLSVHQLKKKSYWIPTCRIEFPDSIWWIC